MCTVVLAIQMDPGWPLLLAANRDEQIARPSEPPGRHWPDQPDVVAGRDIRGGGTWLGLNRAGVVATVLNRVGTLGPAPGKRSRGELPLLALRHPTAAEATTELTQLRAEDWRGFNMIVADRTGAFFLRGTGAGTITALSLPPGIHMVTAHDPNDLASPRIAHHLPRFRAAKLPNPPDWSAWKALLADTGPPPLFIPPTDGFGTVTSSVIALGRVTQFQATLGGEFREILLF